MSKQVFFKFLRNSTLFETRAVAKTNLEAKLATLTDGEVATASYGASWEASKTIFGIVRVVDGQKSYTVYEPFGNDAIDLGDGLEFNADDELTIKLTDSEKILAKGADGLTATVAMSYDKEAKKIFLTGKNNAAISEIDTTDFVKDGMLESAELVVDPKGQTKGTYIKLVWNTDGEKDEMFINVTSLIDIYTEGNGITVSDDKVISAKVDANTEKNGEGADATPYLTVGTDGLKVAGINKKIDDEIKAVLKDYEATVYADPFEAKVTESDAHVAANDEIKTAVKKVEKTISLLTDEVLANEEVISKAINDMATAAGVIDEEGVVKYTPKSDANYISGATSVNDATVILDGALKELEDNALKVSDAADNAIEVKNETEIYLSTTFDCGTY